MQILGCLNVTSALDLSRIAVIFGNMPHDFLFFF